jgi:prophage antirepressor-like protein
MAKALTTSLIPFKFHEFPVRVFADSNGEPWFVAKDVCDVLGIVRANRAVSNLDSDEKDAHIVSTPGGDQTMIVINEAGFYKLVLRSRKLAAKDFQRWATHEVLPTIRKTGSYSLVGESDMTSTVKELVGAVRELGGIVRDLLSDKIKSLPAIRQIAPRDQIGQLVRKYAARNHLDFEGCWKELYREFTYRYHINLLERAQNRIPETTGVAIAEELGIIEDLLALTIYLFK